ncbi:MAG: dolichol kinase [Halobacteriaceae archaeon]
MIEAAELRRRLVHVAGTGYPLLYLLDQRFAVGIVGWMELQLLVTLSALGGLGLEALRLTGVVDWWIFDELTREYEEDYVAGYALYLIGMAVAVVAYEPTVAVPATLMLTIGDPISGLLSSGTIGKATWVLFAMFAVCLLLASPFVPPVVAVLGAAVATAADGFKPVVFSYVIDDNLTIPIGSGAAMTAALMLL